MANTLVWTSVSQCKPCHLRAGAAGLPAVAAAVAVQGLGLAVPGGPTLQGCRFAQKLLSAVAARPNPRTKTEQENH